MMYLVVLSRKGTDGWAPSLRSAPPADARFSRVADSPRMRAWLMRERTDVLGVWGPYNLLSIPQRLEDCLEEYRLFPA